MIAALWVLALLALVQGTVSLRAGWRNMRYALDYRSPAGPGGRVVVFCPVKGAAADLAVNARSLLEQRHPDCRIVFIVEDRDDPALRVLESIEGAESVVAGRASGRGQKVHNLASALGVAGRDADIYAFADADARFPPNWLGDLVAPLGDPGIGAATGYRWYVPTGGRFSTRLRSSWNAAVAGFLGPHSDNFVWGGSTAIRRETFERARVLECWSGAVSDDYAVTEALRRAGLPIVFVPTCLVPSFEPCTWRGLFEFTNRQMRITRVYAPRIWRIGALTYSLFNLTWIGLFLAIPFAPALAGPWLLILGLAAVRAELRRRGAARAIADPSLRRHRWFYRLSPPLVALLYQVNFAASAFSRRIVWAGIRYRLISPRETRVEGREESGF